MSLIDAHPTKRIKDSCARCSSIKMKEKKSCLVCHQPFCGDCFRLSVLKNPCNNGLPHKYTNSGGGGGGSDLSLPAPAKSTPMLNKLVRTVTLTETSTEMLYSNQSSPLYGSIGPSSSAGPSKSMSFEMFVGCDRCGESNDGSFKCKVCLQLFCSRCAQLSGLKNPCSNGLSHSFPTPPSSDLSNTNLSSSSYPALSPPSPSPPSSASSSPACSSPIFDISLTSPSPVPNDSSFSSHSPTPSPSPPPSTLPGPSPPLRPKSPSMPCPRRPSPPVSPLIPTMNSSSGSISPFLQTRASPPSPLMYRAHSPPRPIGGGRHFASPPPARTSPPNPPSQPPKKSVSPRGRNRTAIPSPTSTVRSPRGGERGPVLPLKNARGSLYSSSVDIRSQINSSPRDLGLLASNKEDEVVCGRCSNEIVSGGTMCSACGEQFCDRCVKLSALKNPCSNGLPHKFHKISTLSPSLDELSKDETGSAPVTSPLQVRRAKEESLMNMKDETGTSAPVTSPIKRRKEKEDALLSTTPPGLLSPIQKSVKIEEPEVLKEEFKESFDDLKALHRLLLRLFIYLFFSCVILVW